jgi:hypothetical protein
MANNTHTPGWKARLFIAFILPETKSLPPAAIGWTDDGSNTMQSAGPSSSLIPLDLIESTNA